MPDKANLHYGYLRYLMQTKRHFFAHPCFTLNLAHVFFQTGATDPKLNAFFSC